MIKHFKSQRWILVILLFTTLPLFSCTTIPTKEFTTYKEAFEDTRAAGQEVLFNYAAYEKEYEKAKEEIDKAAAELQPDNANHNEIKRPNIAFDPVKAADSTVKVDDIEIRLKAWLVVARFNDLLTGLAEGKSVNELTAGVDGLATSLSNFPLGQVADAVGEFMPYVGLLKTIIATAEMERQRQLFVNAVKEGGPKIEKVFIKFLRDDSKNYYRIGFLFNDLKYKRIRNNVTELVFQYENLVSKYKPDTDLTNLTDQVNKLLAKIGLEKISLEDIEQKKTDSQKKAAKTPDDLVISQFTQIKDQIKEKVAEAEQKSLELIAYRDMMVAYVMLINQMSDTLKALTLAVQENQTTIPSSKDLVPVLIELKKAIKIYQDSRRT